MQTTHHHLIHSTAPPAALIAHYNTHYILHTQLPQRTPRKRQKHATSTPKARHTAKRAFHAQQSGTSAGQSGTLATQKCRCGNAARHHGLLEYIFFAAKATLRHTRPQRRFGMS